MRDLQARNTYACGTVRTNRKDYPSDLRRMKLVRGTTNVLYLYYRPTLPLSQKFTQFGKSFAGVELLKRVVPADAMKKPDVVDVYNGGMNGVDVNDQYRSYYPPGTTSRKWWKYLLWFFVNLSMVNAYILEKLAGKKKT